MGRILILLGMLCSVTTIVSYASGNDIYWLGLIVGFIAVFMGLMNPKDSRETKADK